MQLIKYLSLILFVFAACNKTKSIEEVVYFDNTNIVKSKKVYKNKASKQIGVYTEYTFTKDGNLYSEKEYENHKPLGLYRLYYANGNVKIESILVGNEVKGVQRFFNERNKVISESFIINNKGVLIKKYVTFIDDSLKAYDIYRLKNDTATRMEGTLIYDSNMNFINRKSFYYKDDIEDTLVLHQKSDFVVTLFLLGENTNLKTSLSLGVLNDELSLKDTLCTFTSLEDKTIIQGFITPQNIGYQIIEGKIEIERYSSDTLYSDFTFYKVVYVDSNGSIEN